MLTKRENDVYGYCTGFLEVSGDMPTMSQIAAALGFGKQRAYYLMGRLVEKGVLVNKKGQYMMGANPLPSRLAHGADAMGDYLDACGVRLQQDTLAKALKAGLKGMLLA